MKKRIVGIVLLFFVGFLVMMYPVISDLWNQARTNGLVTVYKEETEKLGSSRLDEIYKEAQAYNEAHTVNSPIDIFSGDPEVGAEYMSLLNPTGNGIMGYIEIPKINQRIVIYHGTSEEVLDKGCGHIAGTSLPVGGKGSHSVIAAHRGLPTAKLFTDLDQMKKGDQFYLFILDRTLAYEVDQIKVVEPDDLDELQIVEGKDYVTLYTCTPYSVNTHRMLVRGHRVKYIPEKNATQTTGEKIIHSWLLKLILALATIALIYLVERRLAGSRNKTESKRR